MSVGMSNAEESAILLARLTNRAVTVKIGLFNVPTTIATTAITQSGAVASVTTASNHGLAVDDIVQIAGVTPSGYNGHWRVVTQNGTTGYTFNTTTGLGTASVQGTSGKWVELSGGSYAEVTIANSDWNAVSGVAPSTITGPKSGVTWAFPQATAGWADSSHPCVGFRLYDNTAASFFWAGTLTTATAINNLDTVQFDSSNVITLQLGDVADPF